MVWSNHDFAREVRRQLIELESIRKRAPADAELHERIDRLEESHHHVLRKLAERSRRSTGAEEILPERTPAEEAEERRPERTPAEEAEETMPESTPAGAEKKARPPAAAPKKSCEGTAGRLDCHARLALPQLLPRALQERTSIERRVKSLLSAQLGLPHPAERCAACGRVLLLSLIAGGQVVFHKAAWYHKDCMEAHEGLN